MKRLSVSVLEELAKRIREAAEQEGLSLSTWLVHAAEAQLRLSNARRAITDWEREHGPISEAEVRRVERAWRG